MPLGGSLTTAARAISKSCVTFRILGYVEHLRRRVVVHGRVQGVWFRESARRRAAELGVAGWVRNRADGAVEAELEGACDDVEVRIEDAEYWDVKESKVTQLFKMARAAVVSEPPSGMGEHGEVHMAREPAV